MAATGFGFPGPTGPVGTAATFISFPRGPTGPAALPGPTGPAGFPGPTGPIGMTGVFSVNSTKRFPPEDGSLDSGHVALDDYLKVRVVATSQAVLTRAFDGPPSINPDVSFHLEEGRKRTFLFASGAASVFASGPAFGLRLQDSLVKELREALPEDSPLLGEIGAILSDEAVQELWKKARRAALRHFVSASASLVVHEIRPDEVAEIWREADVREIMET